ncbi:MAG TPA: prephenate dehydrogenase/arogenate dehydrogenase family protein [Armatimonadota bacterium]|jgi:prephenate dehydrogenase
MAFNRVAIIGIGLIGGSFALAARRAGWAREIIGVARSAETRRLALAAGVADEVTADPAAAVRGADLVYLATPVDTIVSLLGSLGPHLAPGALVTDAGSAKAGIVAAAAALPPSVRFVGGHPMAGSEQAGLAWASPDLFAGAHYFLTPTAATDPAALAQLQELVPALGAVPVLVDPAEHDRRVALTSHLPHLLAWALCRAASEGDSPERLAPFTAGAWRDTTRIAASSPELWAEILLANRKAVQEAAGRWEQCLDELLTALEAGDREALVAALAEAREFHGRMQTSE